MSDIKVLGICGSLRKGSFNRMALRVAQGLVPAGMKIDVADISAFQPYNEDVRQEGFPPAVQTFRDQIAAADALLFVTPEYNYSVSGVLKNAIDWASRPFREAALTHKPVAVIGASTGLFGAVWAQAETRKSLSIAGAEVLEDEFPLGQADEAFGEDGLLLEPELNERLVEILGELAEHQRELAAA